MESSQPIRIVSLSYSPIRFCSKSNSKLAETDLRAKLAVHFMRISNIFFWFVLHFFKNRRPSSNKLFQSILDLTLFENSFSLLICNWTF